MDSEIKRKKIQELKEDEFDVKIADFGRARDLHPYFSITSLKTLYTNRSVRPPEMREHNGYDGDYSAEVDIWGFAAIIFELATGVGFHWEDSILKN